MKNIQTQGILHKIQTDSRKMKMKGFAINNPIEIWLFNSVLKITQCEESSETKDMTLEPYAWKMIQLNGTTHKFENEWSKMN